MSADLQWMIIRNNSCFLLKRNHEQFSREACNLKNKNRYRFNGLIHRHTVGIEEAPNGKGIVMKTKIARKANKPAQMYNEITFTKNPRKTLRSIRNLVGKSNYRRRLKKLAMRRASAYLKSQKQKQKQK